MLTVKNLSISYNGIKAIENINVDLAAGEIVTLIGANGAGKSSLLFAIMGLVPKINGEVILQDKDISSQKTPEIVRLGLSLVPESRDVFSSMTVKANLRLGLFLNGDKATHAQAFENIYALFPRLREKEKQIAGTLSGGEQQMLAIGRALMQKPKYLLLDEPSLGLSPKLTIELFEKIREINREGTAIMLVEQKAKLALQVATRGYLISTGKIVCSGSCDELLQDTRVKKVYFGN